MPTGTRSEAMPPTVAPSANGTNSDEIANAVSITRSSRGVRMPLRSAYDAPRSTIPIPARNRGIDSVEAIEPNAVG